MTADAPFVRLHPDDNVAIAKRHVNRGTAFELSGAESPRGVARGTRTAAAAAITTRDRIDLGHKIAIASIRHGEPVRKFGQLIGYATVDIQPGDWVHSHNLAVGELHLDYQFATDVPPPPAPIEGRTFLGYRRADGRAATRNYIAVVSTVNCSATTSKYVVQALTGGSSGRSLLADFPNIDGVLALIHKGGCAMQYGGEDHQQLARTLAGFARHPNIAAYLVVGLGCETGQSSFLVDNHLVQLAGSAAPNSNPYARDTASARGAALAGSTADEVELRPAGGGPLVMNIQDVGGVARTVDRAVGALREMLPEANRVQRVPIPASEIILGTNCGGSDGYSGVTANPALGIASDMLVACGGTSILAETSEIYGGEHLLTRRAVTREVGEKLIERIRWWERYVEMFGVQIDNNPSVGNKRGGLTTIYEKSLGAIAKGGSTALRAVYQYAEPVTEKGFVVMDTPGYDPASVTGIIAGGANVIAFTTGRGSCFGCKPVPTIKIASNTPMFERMRDDMDINAGRIIDGASVEDVGREIFERVLAVASGEHTTSEAQGIGDEEFCPWSIGPVL
jgi:altronate hydrolase